MFCSLQNTASNVCFIPNKPYSLQKTGSNPSVCLIARGDSALVIVYNQSVKMMRQVIKAFPFLILLTLTIFVCIETVKLHQLYMSLGPDEYMRNATVIEKWSHYVIGGPWDLKHFTAGPVCVFMLGPLADVTMAVFPFDTFPFVTANFVSLVHVILSILSIKLLVDTRLSRRRIGAAIFFVRQYCDELDGKVAYYWIDRGHPPGGRFGFWFDGVSDSVCVFALALAFFVLNHRAKDSTESLFGEESLIRRWRRCCRASGSLSEEDGLKDDSSSASSHLLSDGESGSEDLPSPPNGTTGCNNNNNIVPSSPKWLRPSSHRHPGSSPSSSAPVFKLLRDPKLYLTRKTFLITVTLMAIGLSSYIWNNTVYLYMDYLDVPPACNRKRLIQLEILKSWNTLLVFYGWRFCFPLTLIIMSATAIFFDKTVWFCSFVARRFIWFIIALSITTVVHLYQIIQVLNLTSLC